MSYFRLETLPLDPIGDPESTQSVTEELAEIAPLDYRPSWVLDAGYYDHDEDGREIPLPEGTRCVQRWLRGAFVFFAKGSFYNRLKGKLDAYNAQHTTMGADQFHSFVIQLMSIAEQKGVPIDPIYPTGV
jgi:hypothetical protein